MPMKKTQSTCTIRTLMILPIVAWLLLTSNTFASSEKQSVADIVQDFIQTAQGKQQKSRTTVGDSVLWSIKSFATNIITSNKGATDNTPTIQYASNNTNTSYILDTHTANTNVFFNDIVDNVYIDDINILASQWLVAGYNNTFFPENHVRLGDLSKVIVNAYRLTVWLDASKAKPMEFIQTAYNEWFLVWVVDNTKNIDQDMLINNQQFQTILANIHKQYPKITEDIQTDISNQEYVNKATMAHYVVALFWLTFNSQNYYKKIVSWFKDHPDRDAVMTLIQNDIIPYTTDIDPDKTLSRAAFIHQLIKTYALSNRVVLGDRTYDIVDVDWQDEYTPLIIYAYQQGRLDYMLVQTKGQTFLYPENNVTLDEVYEVITAITQKNIVTGIIPYNQKVTQWQIATILVEVFKIQKQTEKTIITPTSSNTTIVQRVMDLFAKL